MFFLRILFIVIHAFQKNACMLNVSLNFIYCYACSKIYPFANLFALFAKDSGMPATGLNAP